MAIIVDKDGNSYADEAAREAARATKKAEAKGAIEVAKTARDTLYNVRGWFEFEVVVDHLDSVIESAELDTELFCDGG